MTLRAPWIVAALAVTLAAASCSSSTGTATVATTASPSSSGPGAATTTVAASMAVTSATTSGPAAGATAAGATAASGSAAAGSTAPTTATSALIANADTTATLSVGQPSNPGQWDPHKGTSPTNDFSYMGLLYDRLIELNADLTLSPMLAQSWSASHDNMTLTVKLRTDAKFQDGTAVDAAAVVSNLTGALKADGSLAQTQMKQAYVSGATAPDASTVQITTSQPSYLATFIEMGGVASPDGYADPAMSAGTKSYGSGPYTISSIGQDRATFARNDAYWDKNYLKTAPKSFVLIGFSDDTAKLAALESGQIDALSLLSPIANLDGIVSSKNLVLNNVTKTSRVFDLQLNIKTPGLDNVKVRQALSMATDRKAIAAVVDPKVLTPSVQPWGAGYIGYDSGLDAQAGKVDVDGAKKLMQESGVTNLTINAVTTTATVFSTIGQILQSNFAAIGVTLKITQVPSAQVSGEFSSGKWDGAMLSTNGAPDPAILISDGFFTRQSPGGTTPDLQALYDAAIKLTVGSPEREAAFKKIADFLAANPQHIIIGVWNLQSLSNKRMVGLDRNALGSLQAPVDVRHFVAVKA